MKPKEMRKAFAALLAPVILAVLVGVSTGEWDFEVIATGVSGVLAFVVVYLTPNRSQDSPED